MEILFPVLIVVMVVILIMQMLKQRKTVRQVQDLQSGLQPGDVVMTTAGLHGTVAATGETTIDLEIAPGVVTTWDRRVVRERLTGGDDAQAAGGQAPAGAEAHESSRSQLTPEDRPEDAQDGTTAPESREFGELGRESDPRADGTEGTNGTGLR